MNKRKVYYKITTEHRIVFDGRFLTDSTELRQIVKEIEWDISTGEHNHLPELVSITDIEISVKKIK